ncbi:MAG TPA: hypothetical protein VM283_03445, partial [Armatimonadota bacterium]|nr:hypothetical protein [Armatimonadota bacterium]
PAAPTGYPPAPPPGWQQPPAAYPPAYGYPQQYANNSGTGGPAPPEVLGWNWGAFWMTWLWGITNGVWNSLLVLILGLIWQIVLGAKGSEWAWQHRRFDSVEQFKQTQRAWAMWGWIMFFVSLLGGIAVGIVLAIAASQAGGLPWDF